MTRTLLAALLLAAAPLVSQEAVPRRLRAPRGPREASEPDRNAQGPPGRKREEGGDARRGAAEAGAAARARDARGRAARGHARGVRAAARGRFAGAGGGRGFGRALAGGAARAGAPSPAVRPLRLLPGAARSAGRARASRFDRAARRARAARREAARSGTGRPRRDSRTTSRARRRSRPRSTVSTRRAASEEASVASLKVERERLLARERSQTALQRREVSALTDKASRLERLLETLARQSESEEPVGPSGGIRPWKGVLDWPAKGTIIETFGRHRHPKFNAWTVSNGVALAVPLGTPVRAVYAGKTIYAQWLAGVRQSRHPRPRRRDADPLRLASGRVGPARRPGAGRRGDRPGGLRARAATSPGSISRSATGRRRRIRSPG